MRERDGRVDRMRMRIAAERKTDRNGGRDSKLHSAKRACNGTSERENESKKRICSAVCVKSEEALFSCATMMHLGTSQNCLGASRLF